LGIVQRQGQAQSLRPCAQGFGLPLLVFMGFGQSLPDELAQGAHPFAPAALQHQALALLVDMALGQPARAQRKQR
jgi:hypothetical protein